MVTVGIRELKAQLSAYVKQARMGQRVQVTDRGTVVAEIVPAGWGEAEPVPPGLAALAREGRVRMATRQRRQNYSTPRAQVPAGTIARLLEEERGER